LSSSAKGLAGRYAGALYALADESGKIDAIVKDMTGVAELVSGNPDMRTLVGSPAISWAEQTKAITAILEKGGADALTSNLLARLHPTGVFTPFPKSLPHFLLNMPAVAARCQQR